jgi:ATP-dependent exoDNAse (exonuclease V) beta subunit
VSLVDADVRRRIREDLEASFLVEAAAGTGKTQAAVDRMVAQLGSGRVRIDGLVAVTFTRKAAGELKLRLRRALDVARSEADADPDRRRRWEDALVRLDEARVSTIHGFCADVLRTWPVEADIDPAFVELSEAQAEALHARVVRRWFERQLGQLSRPLARFLARSASSAWRETPLEQLTRASWALIEHRDLPAPWPRPEAGAPLRELVDRAMELGRRLGGRPSSLAASLHAKGLTKLQEFGRVHATEVAEEELEAQLLEAVRYRPKVSLTGTWKDGTSAPRLAQELRQLRVDVDAYRRRADAELAAELRDVLWDTVDAYQAAKRRQGALDFADLQLCARSLLERPEVRASMGTDCDAVFVDEFQDTDPVQAEILMATARAATGSLGGGRLFLVGDPKQSIYGWRRADMGFYLSFRERVRTEGVELLQLHHSFRATDELQAFVNRAFVTVFDDDPGQPPYVPIAGGPPAPEGAPPPVLAFAPPGPSSPSNQAFAAASAEGLAELLAWVVEHSGWRVRDPERPGTDRPLRPRDIGVLVPRMNLWGDVDPPRLLVEGLDRSGIPWLMLRRRVLEGRDELSAVRAVLSAVEWPRNRYWMYAALRGPFFFFTDDHLARWLEEVGPLRATEASVPSELEPLAETLRFLEGLSARRNERPVTATLGALFEHTRAPGAFAHEASGPEAVAQFRALSDLAERHEREEQGAFRSLVERLDTVKESELAEEQLEADGIRILTAHSAKGLEFPVVVLADPTYRPRPRDKRIERDHGRAQFKLAGLSPLGLHDEDPDALGEAMRLAYVAATRARDCLVVCVHGNPDAETWVGPVQTAVLDCGPGRAPEPSRLADQLARTGASTVLGDVDPQRLKLDVRAGAYPGEGYRVEWTPARPFLPRPEDQRLLRRVDALEEGGAAQSGREAYTAWVHHRQARLRKGARPSLRLVRASQADLAPPTRVGPVELQRVERSRSRPSGRRFGQLVHEVLRAGPEADVAVVVDRAGRQLGATPDEIQSAAAAVQAAAQHPVLAAAAASDTVHREFPVTLETDEGWLLDGVIDLLYREAEGWVVVDYKTHLVEPSVDDVRAQLQWYLYAVDRTLGGTSRGVVLLV